VHLGGTGHQAGDEYEVVKAVLPRTLLIDQL
jgi:hypothetical protein